MPNVSSIVLDPVTNGVVTAARRPPFLYEVGAPDGREALAEIQDIPELPGGLVYRQIELDSAHGPVVTHVVHRIDQLMDETAILYAHGGGWTMGEYATHARFAHEVARRTGATVVVPDYALAPEHRYPVALEQITSVLESLAAGSAHLPAFTRIGLVGDCAGASILAALATQPEVSAMTAVRAVVLLYPVSEPYSDDASAVAFSEGFGLRLSDIRHLVRQYGPRPSTRALAAFDPLGHEAPFAPTAPILIVTAEADVTRDRAEHFAARLRGRGAPVTTVRYLGAVHDFAVLDALRFSPPSIAVTTQVVSFLDEHLNATVAVETAS